MATEDDRFHKELLAIYNHVHGNIENIKKRQWTQFTLVLAGQGAMVTFFRSDSQRRCSWIGQPEVLVVVVLLAFVAGLFLVKRQEQYRQQYRQQSALCQQQFTWRARSIL